MTLFLGYTFGLDFVIHTLIDLSKLDRMYPLLSACLMPVNESTRMIGRMSCSTGSKDKAVATMITSGGILKSMMPGMIDQKPALKRRLQ